MTVLKAILMGLIQGVAEFLPISSSGHLVLFKQLFHVNTDTGILFDVMLHLGTLLAVFVVFRKEIGKLCIEFIKILADIGKNAKIFVQSRFGKKDWGFSEAPKYHKVIANAYRKFALLILVSTIPTAILGYLAKDLVKLASENLLVPGIGLILTAILLLIADMVKDQGKTPKQVSYTNGFVIGICQGIATLPGLSRSGTTIAAALISGFDRKFAVKYSFLMSIPAILGASVLELPKLKGANIPLTEIAYYGIGMAVAAVTGYICIKTMLVVVKKKKFLGFSIYCFLVGVAAVVGFMVQQM
ncbi:undecaprenyl-diphosphatase [Clostridia bacterium]|nr:undecaprenyl-diphosphatase [Clostridia bacterium]